MSALIASGVTPTYTTTAEKFGTAALSGGYGTGTGGTTYIYATPSLKAVPFAIKAWGEPTSNPASGNVGVLFGTISPETLYVGLNSSGEVTFQIEDSAGKTSAYTGSSAIALAAYAEWEVDVTAAAAYLYIGGTLIATLTPSSGATFNFVPAEIAIGNAYGYSDFPWIGNIDEVSIWSTALHTGANYTPQTQPYVGNEANLVNLYHLDSSLADSAVSPTTTLVPTMATTKCSVMAWAAVTTPTTGIKAINAGNPAEWLIAGGITTLELTFDVSGLLGDFPRFQAYVDGIASGPIQIPASGAVTLTIPSSTLGIWSTHTLKLVPIATTEYESRWSPQAAYVLLTGIVVTPGTGLTATLSAPPSKPSGSIAIFGNSIDEGFRTRGGITVTGAGTGTIDTPYSDATQSWAGLLGDMLGMEVAQIGFGGSGVSVTGEGGVPAWSSVYNFLWSGQPRPVASDLKAIVVELLTNDLGQAVAPATMQTASLALLNQLIAYAPGVPIAWVEPFDSTVAALYTATARTACANALKAAIAACSSPSSVTFISTDGLFPGVAGSSFEGLHPYGWISRSTIAPAIAAALKPILFPAGSTRTYSFHN